MVQSITALSAAPPATQGGAVSAASLQGQLQRFQQQLSDCVNCSSAKTPEGKADIDAIASKIGQIERRIDQLGKGQPGANSADSAAKAGASDDRRPATQSEATAVTPPPAPLLPTAFGAPLDLYA